MSQQRSFKPRAYVCYLCGQQYGSHSLKIHIPQCQEKFTKVQAQRSRADRRCLPATPAEILEELPTGADGIDAFNSRMMSYFNTVSLFKCASCGRSFHSEAYDKHAQRCPGKVAAATNATQRVPSCMTATKMKVLCAQNKAGWERLCPWHGECAQLPAFDHVEPHGTHCRCGQQFGSSSLNIHIPQCLDKWNKVNELKPAGERRQPPATPPELQIALPKDAAAIDEFNSKMLAIFNGASLNTCCHCGRSFNDEAFKRHQKLCTREQPLKPAPQRHTPPEAPPTARKGVTARGRPLPARYTTSSPNLPPDKSHGTQHGEDVAQSPREDLHECSTCRRTFTALALQRHAAICAKARKHERSCMDSAGQRTGELAAKYKAKPGCSVGPRTPCSTTGQEHDGGHAAAWKQQSQGLRQAMKASREVQRRLKNGESLADIPHIPSGPDPSLLQCPHCGRRFNEKAAERHIPKCATIINKPKFLKAGTGGSGQGAPKLLARVPGR